MLSEYNLNKKSNFGLIEVVCGSMFSGKTEELIRRIKKAEYSRLKTVVFKPKIDSRSHGNYISTHNNKKYKAFTVTNENEIIEKSKKHDVVGIDEAQFFSNSLVDICNLLANEGKRIIVAGLDMDYKGNPFGPMPNLMATAEYVTKVHAVCTHTGNLAQYSFRKSDDDNLVFLGQTGEYEPLSRAAYYHAMGMDKTPPKKTKSRKVNKRKKSG